MAYRVRGNVVECDTASEVVALEMERAAGGTMNSVLAACAAGEFPAAVGTAEPHTNGHTHARPVNRVAAARPRPRKAKGAPSAEPDLDGFLVALASGSGSQRKIYDVLADREATTEELAAAIDATGKTVGPAVVGINRLAARFGLGAVVVATRGMVGGKKQSRYRLADGMILASQASHAG